MSAAKPVGRPRAWRELEVLWCSNQRKRRGNGWAFPPRVRSVLFEFCRGLRVVHLFGGQARFGVRLDVDSRVRPDVLGDAWLPPFRRDAFDVAILDPPYFALNQQMKTALLHAAGWVARRWVIWFHTQWIAGNFPCRPERAWLVRVGDSCSVRCLQVFRVEEHKRLPDPWFSRGPAVRYNRWLGPQARLPFALEVASVSAAAEFCPRGGVVSAAAELVRITPRLDKALKLRAPGACDYCDQDAGALFACMGVRWTEPDRCTFVHGCVECFERHVRSSHRGEDRYAVREAAP